MNKTFFLTALTIICLASFTPGHGVQAATRASTKVRSLVTSGFDGWMAITQPYSKPINYVGAGVSGPLLLKYFYHVFQLKRNKKHIHAPHANNTRAFLIGSTLCWFIAAPSWKTGAAAIAAFLLPRFPDPNGGGGSLFWLQASSTKTSR